jgi:hypothetical protein
MKRKFMRLSQIFPELKRAARERQRFDQVAGKVDRAILSGNWTRAESDVRELFYRILKYFDEDMRDRYFAEALERWGRTIPAHAVLDDCRYRLERKRERKKQW